MNQNQYLNRKTLLLGILGILLLGLSGCTSKTPSLKGSWEMFVGKGSESDGSRIWGG